MALFGKTTYAKTLLIALLILTAISLTAAASQNRTGGTKLWLGETKLWVELADTPETREKGLSGRPALAAGRGMLFVFPQDSQPAFWMKEMRFAIDIIWIDAGKKVAAINKNVPPSSFPQIFLPPRPIRYVLEVKAGTADRLDWQIGDKLSTAIHYPNTR